MYIMSCNTCTIDSQLPVKCEKVLLDYVFKDHTIEETLSKFSNVLGPLVFPTDGTTTNDSEGLLVDAPQFT